MRRADDTALLESHEDDVVVLLDRLVVEAIDTREAKIFLESVPQAPVVLGRGTPLAGDEAVVISDNLRKTGTRLSERTEHQTSDRAATVATYLPVKVSHQLRQGRRQVPDREGAWPVKRSGGRVSPLRACVCVSRRANEG